MLRMVTASIVFCLLANGCVASELDTPEKMLAEFSPIRSQKGIRVVDHARLDNRSGFDCMWHLRHSPRRFKTLSEEAGFHRCKEEGAVWQRDDAIREFHLELVTLARYTRFCSREPGDLVLVSPDRSESYYFAVVF